MYIRTLEREQKIRKFGYNLIVKWEHEDSKMFKNVKFSTTKTKVFPHFIVYNFKSKLDRSVSKYITKDLSKDCVHIPISVSIGDSIKKEPEDIFIRDPKRLIEKFMGAIESKAKVTREKVRAEFKPYCFDLLLKLQINVKQQSYLP